MQRYTLAAVAVLLVLFTDASWPARAGLLLLTLAVLVAVELAVDAFIARRRENAARAERDNVAVLLDAIAERHQSPSAAGPRALPPAGRSPEWRP